MSISIERYVSITSGVIGAAVVAQRELIGLRFTTDPRVPIDAIARVNKTGASALFGATSPEAVFSNQYFGYISPAPASQAQALIFAAFADVARPPRVYGAKRVFALAQFTAVTAGALSLTMGATAANLTGINLSTAASLADVAGLIQAAIRADVAGGVQWTGAAVTFDPVKGAFMLVGGESANAPVAITAAPVGTDLGALLGWRDASAIESPGSVAQTPLEALQAVEQITDSFGSLSFGSEIDLADAIAVSQYVAALNVKYQYFPTVTLDNAESFYAAMAGFASTGLVLNAKAGEYKEALPAAIMAATNYQRRNSTVNYMFRQGLYSAPFDVHSDEVADVLDPLRVNYYGETSSAGQKLAFFQRGVLCGGATAPLDMNVHANEQWFKAYMQAGLLSLQISLGKIPANDDGRGLILAKLNGGVVLAKFNGTISLGKLLTVDQQIAITQLTGDPDAWRDVQTSGYWADVTIVQRLNGSGVTEYVAVYTIAYSKNDVIRIIEGSHNLV